MIFVKKNHIEAKSQIQASIGTEAWFTLKAIKGGSCVRRRSFRATDPFKNLITNNGLNNMFAETAGNTYRSCIVGTGTTPPSVTDNALASFLAAVASNPTSQSASTGLAPDYISSRSLTWLSNVGALGNNNLTEIAVSGSTGSNTNLFSRTLIQDSMGNPTAFPISSDEQLEVTYELRLVPPLVDSMHQIQIGSVTHDVVVRALGVTSTVWQPAATSGSNRNFAISNAAGATSIFDGQLGAITANQPQGAAALSTSRGDYSYSAGSFELESWVSWGTGAANRDNVTARVGYGCCAFQMEYSPPISKTDEQTLRLEFKISASRV